MTPETALAITEREIISSPPDTREERGQQLANQFVKFIGESVPLLIRVRQDFLDKHPDETICGVKTFDEYCTGVLRYSRRRIQQLIAGDNPASTKHDGSANRKSKPSAEITDEELAEWEYANHRDIRSIAKKLLLTMSPTLVIGALVGMNVPEPYAKAAVRIMSAGMVTIPEPETQPDPTLDNPKQLTPEKIQQTETAQRLQDACKQVGMNVEISPSREIGMFHIKQCNVSEADIQQIIDAHRDCEAV